MISESSTTTKPRIDKIRIVRETDEFSDEKGYLVIYAEAEVSYQINPVDKYRRIERLSSSGLYGIDDQQPEEYLKEVEQEQLDELKCHLKRFNVEVSNFETVTIERH